MPCGIIMCIYIRCGVGHWYTSYIFQPRAQPPAGASIARQRAHFLEVLTSHDGGDANGPCILRSDEAVILIEGREELPQRVAADERLVGNRDQYAIALGRHHQYGIDTGCQGRCESFTPPVVRHQSDAVDPRERHGHDVRVRTEYDDDRCGARGNRRTRGPPHQWLTSIDQ